MENRIYVERKKVRMIRCCEVMRMGAQYLINYGRAQCAKKGAQHPILHIGVMRTPPTRG